MTPKDQVIARVKYFEDLYVAFYGYFAEKLKKDDSKFNKYHLQMQTVFFDDLDLQKVLNPVLPSGVSNVAEKSAVARAALYDALVAHFFGSFLAQADQQVHARITELEELVDRHALAAVTETGRVEKFSQAAANRVVDLLSVSENSLKLEIVNLKARIKGLENKLKEAAHQEPQNVPEREQSSQGTQVQAE